MILTNFDTTLYYLFSTISQTLAGGVALVGAFVLYKLQAINNELLLDAKEIHNIVQKSDILSKKMNKTDKDNRIFFRLQEKRDFESMIRKCEEILNKKYSKKEREDRFFDALTNRTKSLKLNLNDKKEIKEDLKRSVSWSIISIILSNLFIVPISFYIKGKISVCSLHFVIASLFSILAFFFFFKSLLTYKKIIFKSIKEPYL